MYFFYHRLLDVLAKFSCSWIIVGFNTNWQLHHLGNIFLNTILNIFGGSISHGLSTFNYYFIHEKVHKSIWIKRGTGTYIQYMYYLQCQNTGLQSGNREVFFLSHSKISISVTWWIQKSKLAIYSYMYVTCIVCIDITAHFSSSDVAWTNTESMPAGKVYM